MKLMHLKSKLMLMNRKSLVLGATAVLSVAAMTAVGATAYVRNAPVLATAVELANGLVGRSATSLLPAEQGAPGPIAQAITPVAPAAAPATPVLPPAPEAPGAAQRHEAPTRVALTGEPPAAPTITPGAGPGPAFIPTASTTRPVAVQRPSPVGAVVVRRGIREICK